jgi:MFS family permease
MSIALVNTLAGLSAADGARGKIFGLLSLNAGLGTLFGGLAMGPIAERWGYPTLFTCLSLFGLLWPVAALTLQDSKAQAATSRDTRETRQRVGLGRSFYCLLLGSLTATLAAYVFIVGRSLVMADLGYGATAISSTSALSEAPLLPLPVLLGRLSDRFGRRRFLALGYLAAAAGLLGLTASASLLHFLVSSVLVTVSLITAAVGTALVTDLVPRGALGKALSLFGATTGIAGVLGCAGAGYAVQILGPVATFVPAALLPLIAIALLFAARGVSQAQKPAAMPLQQAPAAELRSVAA